MDVLLKAYETWLGILLQLIAGMLRHGTLNILKSSNIKPFRDLLFVEARVFGDEPITAFTFLGRSDLRIYDYYPRFLHAGYQTLQLSLSKQFAFDGGCLRVRGSSTN